MEKDIHKVDPNIWAKTYKLGEGYDAPSAAKWHPLILHMLDVAASADCILAREPLSTRMRMASVLGLDWKDARLWILVVIACHDLGKACPGFQCKWPPLLPLAGLRMPRSPDTKINHAFVSQISLAILLPEAGWPVELADLVADAVGCHHGERASPNTLEFLKGAVVPNSRDPWRSDWAQARRDFFGALLEVFKPGKTPSKQGLSGPDFMLLSGLTSFADWIGSNEAWFPFGNPEECENLAGWFWQRRAQAERALDAIGWGPRTPLSSEPKPFEQVFGFPPRPLQQAVTDALVEVKKPVALQG